MEVMHSSHQRSSAAAEQAMPRILETERRYVSSPETARRAGSGGAVVFRPESALSRSRYIGVSLPQECSTAEQVFYTWVARSRSGSSSFAASALNKPEDCS